MITSEKDIRQIIDWFDERKVLFYQLGWIYLKNDHDMEEVFHQTIINVYDEIHKFKDTQYFDAWLTSIFIHHCRELSTNNQLQVSKDGLLNTLHDLEDTYKDPIVLTYICELSLEEAAYILKTPIETVKSRLLHGLQLLSRKIDSESCKVYEEKCIDYIARTLNRSEKVEFEIHLHTCENCQKKLSTFQEVIFTLKSELDALEIPTNIIKKVNHQVIETVTKKSMIKKKRIKLSVIVTSLLTLLIITGIATNTFSNIYYSWVDWRQQEDPLLRAYYKNGIGERLNMEVVSNGVKVKVKTAIADEFQTVIYYEIEDLNDENQYMIGFEGVKIKEDEQILNHVSNPEIVQNDGQKVYKGKMSIEPTLSKTGTIEFYLSKLQKVNQQSQPGGQIDYFEGKWNFKIPFTKHPSTVHKVDKETLVDGTPIKFKKLTIAPTVTMLQYDYEGYREGSYIMQDIGIDSIETKGKKAKAEMFAWNLESINYGNVNKLNTTRAFETLYFDDPTLLNVHFDSIKRFVIGEKKVTIDVSKDFPQSFIYQGSIISINEITIGNPTKIVMEYELGENRSFENIQFQFKTEIRGEPLSMSITSSEGVYLDKTGEKYDGTEYIELKQPRYYKTKETIELSNDYSDEHVVPKQLEIFFYSTTKYIDEREEIVLD
ncbi:DUF4179 domain-containing protein [Fredinandcohnia sp. SECRCQ15]|uniref:DUF4179 domain-containing protein n=1 Tax=Fredinandcohnia quinoae TaxID=2918902 RepID=A0AAW5EBK9_9BACI|nr:DUF4179 domain-containing protein [Fredinandcohnia sp. SECRCQ15]